MSSEDKQELTHLDKLARVERGGCRSEGQKQHAARVHGWKAGEELLARFG